MVEFVDINCMIGEWGFKDLRFNSAEGLICEMDRLAIGKALVYHSTSWMYDPKSGNDEVIECIGDNDRLLPVMALTSSLDYEFGGSGQVRDFIRRNKIKAVRLFPFDSNYTLNLWNIDKLFSLMNELSMPVLIECRGRYGSIDPHYSLIYELCSTFRAVPLILLNPGYRSTRIFYELFDKCPNFHTDSSTLIAYRGIEDIVRHFGSKRILFGSRMPFMDGGVSVGRLIYADISWDEKADIAGRNIMELTDNINV